jgi:hypothetical protein
MCVSIAHLLEKESGIRQIEKRRKSAGVVGLFAFLPHQPFGLTTVRPRRLVAPEGTPDARSIVARRWMNAQRHLSAMPRRSRSRSWRPSLGRWLPTHGRLFVEGFLSSTITGVVNDLPRLWFFGCVVKGVVTFFATPAFQHFRLPCRNPARRG